MKDYLKQHAIMHERDEIFIGGMAIQYADKISDVVNKFNPKKVLDYGCGKGRQYIDNNIHENWSCGMPTLYDPCYKPFSRKPSDHKFDGVICTDVLEHVPKEDLDRVLAEIFSFAAVFVYISVSTIKAKKSLPNGDNCHATIEPLSWWKSKIIEINKSGVFVRLTDGKEIIDVNNNERLMFYIGTDGEANFKAEKALEYSIQKSSSLSYNIEWMDTFRGKGNWMGWNKDGWYTRFSHFRFAVPEVNDFSGRAVYMDVDQIILKDPVELFNLDLPEDKAWIALDPSRTDVVVFDCDKFKNIPNWPSLRELKENKNKDNIGTYVNKIKDYWHPLPHRWCCNDGGVSSNQANKFKTEEYDPETTCLIHYTQMNWQPWKPYPYEFDYPPHPHARVESLWWQMYAGALESKL